MINGKNLPVGLNTIINGNCIDVLRGMPDHSVDMVFADPPYNMQLGGNLIRPNNTVVDAVNDNWDKFENFSAYDDFTFKWLKEVKRVLKKDGNLWVIGSYHNVYRLGSILQNLGYWILNDIVWVKSNPMPNFKGTRFTNAHETLLWCSPNQKSKYTFNYEAMKMFNDGTQMRSDWHLPICSGGERLKDKDGNKVHSTQKPESLLYRIMLAASNVGDVVLDPFFGSGTTGAVAKKLGRNYIGIEMDRNYIKAAQKRIDNVEPVEDLSALTNITKKKKEVRIPFSTLLEKGDLKPGDHLSDSKKRFEAKILADGSLQSGKLKGSIHRVGADLQNLPSCNGWTFWYYNKSKQFAPIDNLRKKVREELGLVAT